MSCIDFHRILLNDEDQRVHVNSCALGQGLLPKIALLAICRPSGCTVASGVVGVVGVCNRSQMRTTERTCLIFGVSIGLDPG